MPAVEDRWQPCKIAVDAILLDTPKTLARMRLKKQLMKDVAGMSLC